MGSGKTTLVRSICESVYKQKFNQIFLLSPSPSDLDINIPQSNINEEFDLDWIFQKIEDIKTSMMKPKKIKPIQKSKFDKDDSQDEEQTEIQKNTKPKQILIIFDDMIGDIKKHEYDPKLKKLIWNRRHLFTHGTDNLITASIIITSQYYMELPKKIRSGNISALLYFKQGKEDYLAIYKDWVLDEFNKNQWIDVNREIFNLPGRSFIFLRRDDTTEKKFRFVTTNNDKMIFHNFY